MNGYDDSEFYGDLGFRKLSTAELWRLSDSLNVVDAAILITGNDPSTQAKLRDDDSGLEYGQKTDYEGFLPALKALKDAIKSNKLQAQVKHSMRAYTESHSADDGYSYEVVQMPHEDSITYDMLVARMDPTSYSKRQLEGKTASNFDVSEIRHNGNFYICKEPNWSETMIEVEALKDWLKSKGLHPQFFFPDSPAEGFRDKNHPRYSTKLATVVAAWEAVEEAAPNHSVKQTLDAWIQSNGVEFGIGANGIISPALAKELAAIPNWQTGGGATATASSENLPPDQPKEPVQNYSHGYKSTETDLFDDSSDIPF